MSMQVYQLGPRKLSMLISISFEYEVCQIQHTRAGCSIKMTFPLLGCSDYHIPLVSILSFTTMS